MYGSNINIALNDLVYVENIGYGSMVDCGKYKSIAIENVEVLEKK